MTVTSFSLLAAVVAVAACGGQKEAGPSPVAPAPAAAAVDLSPFRGSQFFELFDLGDDPKRLVDELDKLPEELAGMGGEAPAGKPGPGELRPRVPFDRRMLWALAPFLVGRLDDLDAKSEWTEDDAAAADAVVAFLADRLGAPRIELGREVAERHRQVARVGRWLMEAGGKPEIYAAMIFTMDDGPFAGLPPEEGELPPAAAETDLGGGVTVSFCERKGADGAAPRWIVRTAKDGETVDTRLLTNGAGHPYTDVDLSHRNRVDLGRWGSRLNFTIAGELAQLYVGPDGKILFYFVSW